MSLSWKKGAIIVAALAVVAGGAAVATNHEMQEWLGIASEPGEGLPFQPRERAEMMAGENPAEAAQEAFEAATIAEQFAEARTAPGIVAPGAYSTAYTQLTSMPTAGGAWTEVTTKPYDADDPDYRDYASNSSGGAGKVTGRITGLAADNSGHVYAAGADGGVWRSSTGGGNWTPIADGLPSLSSGTLVLAGGELWYGTGEANTGGTSYVGSGVYRLANPASGSFSPANRVGGSELESTVINRLRFIDGKVWAATNRGLYSHPAGTNAGSWKLEFAPNKPYLDPNDPLSKTANAPYKNIVNDMAGDPKNPKHIIVASAWRSGDTYNGFYEATDYTTGSWVKVNPGGAIPANDIGNVTFAMAADGSKLYAINQAPSLLNKATGTVNSYLDGVYVSNNGSPAGPWNKIADTRKLGNSGSALKQAVSGKGYGPGIQAWYNQFMAVDPANPQHIWVGLEEVYESTNGGSSWNTVGPYWNFYFPCWNISDSANSCPKSPMHPDQHSVAVGDGFVYVGNDGGVFRRPVNGQVNADGHATDWKSLNDGTMDALQYYSVAVGADPQASGVVVSGGLQDNGASVLRPGMVNMASHFGGDGGDALADPANGCRQVQEYVGLAMRSTVNCNKNPGALTEADATSRAIQPYNVSPGDEPARFIAPFAPADDNANTWVAGGQHVWVTTDGYAMTSGKDWKKVFDLGAGHTATSVAVSHGVAYVGWCGPCNNNGFARGVAVGNVDGTGWHQADVSALPNRFVQGAGIDPANPQHAYLAINGFSRRFTEGPGAGVGHVYETTNGGATWTDVSANLPDVPASSVKALPNGALILATDLASFYRAPGATDWKRLGTGLPLTVGMDIEYHAATNTVYVATHGRGIWSITLP